MKTTIMAVPVLLLLATSAFAVDAPLPPKGTGPNFEQHKADILNRIDQRIAHNQKEKTCVQSSKSHEDLKACQDKFKSEIREQRPNMPVRK
jgi:hypothetical protein